MTSKRSILREMTRVAARYEFEARSGTFRNWQAQGHVTVLETDERDHITVQIEDEKFRCHREAFPTTQLIAKLGLAIAAGRSDRKRTKDDRWAHQADAFRYGYGAKAKGLTYDMVWLDEADDIYQQPIADRITATVNKKQRGLRP